MAFLNWSDEYLIGDETIDRDHRYLFELLNEFHYAHSQSGDRAQISRVLSRLIGYAEEHFQREELIMSSAGYPGLPEHHAAHEQLVDAIFELQVELESTAIRLERDTLRFMRSWLIEHILDQDMKFSRHLASLRGPPAEQ